MVETPWGYEVQGTVVDGAEAIPPILTLDKFHEMTGNAFVDDQRIQSAIDALTASVRAWCGWHVAPVLSCRMVTDGPAGGRQLDLPCMAVRDLGLVTVDGRAVMAEWRSNGLVRLLDGRFPDRWRSVEVSWEGGVSGDGAEQLAYLVAHRVMHAVALPFGVSSESAGGVSVSYATSVVADAGGPSLTQRDKALLAPWRIVGVR